MGATGIRPLSEDDPQRGYYRTRFSPQAGRDRVWRHICAYLQRYVPARAAVLDLGAGYCSFINSINASEKYALDAFPGFVEHAAAGVRTHVGDCWNLGHLKTGQLDVVFASNLLEHLDRSQVLATLSEVHRVLKPGGRLMLIQPNYRYCSSEYFDDYTHRLAFSHVSLADCIGASGFQVDVVIPRFLPLTFKSRLPHWPWAVAMYLRLPCRPLAKQMLLVATRTNS